MVPIQLNFQALRHCIIKPILELDYITEKTLPVIIKVVDKLGDQAPSLRNRLWTASIHKGYQNENQKGRQSGVTVVKKHTKKRIERCSFRNI